MNFIEAQNIMSMYHHGTYQVRKGIDEVLRLQGLNVEDLMECVENVENGHSQLRQVPNALRQGLNSVVGTTRYEVGHHRLSPVQESALNSLFKEFQVKCCGEWSTPFKDYGDVDYATVHNGVLYVYFTDCDVKFDLFRDSIKERPVRFWREE